MADIATLIDSFDDGTVAAHWSATPMVGSTVTESGGTLNVAMPTGAGFTAVVSTSTYNFIGSHFTAEIVDAAVAANRQVIMYVQQDSTHRYLVSVSVSGLAFFKADNNAGPQVGSTLTYSATDHRWWRIREDSGTVYVDTSPDGSTWTNRWSTALGAGSGWNHGAVLARFVAQNTGATTAWTAKIDNVGGLATTTTTKVVSEALGLVDARTRMSRFSKAITDTLGLIESRTRTGLSKRVRNDTLGLIESRVRKGLSKRVRNDTLGLTETRSRSALSKRVKSETLGIAESRVRTALSKRVVNAVLGLAEAIVSKRQTLVTLNFTPSNDSDDAYVESDGTSFNNISSTITIGKSGSDERYYAAIRFRNVTIPQGTVLNSAKIRFTSGNADSGTRVRLAIWAHDTATPGSFTSAADITGATLGAVKIDWDDAAAWTAAQSDADTTTPELVTAAQPIINKVGWTSGGNMAFQIRDDGSTIGAIRRFTVVTRPVLTITYFSDEAILTKIVSDVLGLIESRTRWLASIRSVNESLGLVDTRVRSALSKRVANDTLGITEARTRFNRIGRVISDTLGISDVAIRFNRSAKVISETLGITSATARMTGFVKVVTDTLGISEIAARVSGMVRVVTDILGILSDSGTSRIVSDIGRQLVYRTVAVSRRVRSSGSFATARAVARAYRIRRRSGHGGNG